MLRERVTSHAIATTKSEAGGLGVTWAAVLFDNIGKKLEFKQEGSGIVAKISLAQNKD